MSSFDPATAIRTQRYLWDLAKALHAGHSWNEIAHALGHPPRAYRAHYRPLVRSYVLRLLDLEGPRCAQHGCRGPQVARQLCADHAAGLRVDVPPAHGTLARYSAGGCYPDGRRCEPCMAAKADQLHRWRNTAPVRTDPPFLSQIARRLVDGDSWDVIAAELGRTTRHVQDQVRDLVQPHCLQLLNVEQPPVSHRPHGSRAAYTIDGCRCEPCTYSGVVYERRRALKKRRGLQPYVDAEPVRQHVVELLEHGIGLKRIAKLSGVPHGSLAKLMYGDKVRGLAPSRRVRRRTADALLTVQPLLDHASDGAQVPADVTWARVRILLEKGATKTWIAQQIGYANPYLRIGTPTVTAATARAVRRLHKDVLTGHLEVQGRRSRWDTRQDVAA